MKLKRLLSMLLAALLVGLATMLIPITTWESEQSLVFGAVIGLACGGLVRVLDFLFDKWP